MTVDRRDFLLRLAGLSGLLVVPPARAVPSSPRVSAHPTVFFAQPEGRNALVRFVIEGSDAPAGRLRVFDRAGRQIGTAGVIGRGGQLIGELWIPLERETDVSSELELPGVRGVLRTTHRLAPRRKWTIYWMTAADTLSSRDAPPEFLDHAEFLRLADGARVDRNGFALDPDGLLDRIATAPLMLAGSGLRWIGVPNAAAPLSRVESRDGSFVVAVSLGGTGTASQLVAGRNEMARRIEQWLEGPGTQLADEAHAIALVVDRDAGDPARLEERLADWNSRFAYPRIVTDRPGDLLAIIERRASARPAGPPGSTPGADPPWKAVDHDVAARAARIFDPLLTRLSSAETGLAALAAQFAFSVPGTLVVNPTPFSATSVVRMPDGKERVITDVPPLGYVCVPYPGYSDDRRATAGRWAAVPGSDNDLTLDGRYFELRIDLETGAIRSLTARGNGRQWARGEGLNAAGGFRLDTLQKFRNEGVGARIVVGRRSGDGKTLTSSITIYDALPWVDITNEQASATEPVTYRFGVALERPAASWEVPAGFDMADGAVERLVHLRWIKLAAGSESVVFRGLDAPVAAITADAAIVSTAPSQRARYRLGFASGFSAPDHAWAFGWGTESLLAAPVPGTGRATLPSFGSLVVTDQSGVCITELRRDAENAVIIYLQELTGIGRDIIVGPGVLTFRSARRVDFTGRHLGDLAMLPSGGTSVPVRGFGVTAVRLGEVELAAK